MEETNVKDPFYSDDVSISSVLDEIGNELGRDVSTIKGLFEKNWVSNVGEVRRASIDSWKKWDLPSLLEEKLKEKIGLRTTDAKQKEKQPHTNPGDAFDTIPLNDNDMSGLLYDQLKEAFSFKQMILSNGLSSIIYHLPLDILAGIQRGLSYSFSSVIFQGATSALQVHDLAIAPAILLVQAGINLGRWYCGDISVNKAGKNMAVNFTAVVCGGLGTWGGIATATAIGAAVGTAVGPIGTLCGGILGAIVGAIIGCAVAQPIADKICPDGPLDDFIIKRNEMLESLKQLGCTESSSDTDIKKAYIKGLFLYHPDKNINCYTKEIKEKFTTHLVAHHIIITYRETIENAKKNLTLIGVGFYPQDNNITEEGDEKIRDDLKKHWNEIEKNIGTKLKKTLKKKDQLKESKNQVRSLEESPNIEENDEQEMGPFWEKKKSERNLMRKKAQEEQHTKEIKDLEKEIEDLEKERKDKEYYYYCLWIHYYNRTPKNNLRKMLDFFENPFKIVDKSPDITGLIEDKK